MPKGHDWLAHGKILVKKRVHVVQALVFGLVFEIGLFDQMRRGNPFEGRTPRLAHHLEGQHVQQEGAGRLVVLLLIESGDRPCERIGSAFVVVVEVVHFGLLPILQHGKNDSMIAKLIVRVQDCFSTKPAKARCARPMQDG